MEKKNNSSTRPSWLKKLYAAWLIGTFLHAQRGLRLPFQDEPLVEIALQVGVLYGYFVVYQFSVSIATFVPYVWLKRQVERRAENRCLHEMFNKLLSMSFNYIDGVAPRGVLLIAVSVAFLSYSAQLADRLAPTGLIIALAMWAADFQELSKLFGDLSLWLKHRASL